jgi:hypothetical protein
MEDTRNTQKLVLSINDEYYFFVNFSIFSKLVQIMDNLIDAIEKTIKPRVTERKNKVLFNQVHISRYSLNN